MAQTGSAIAMVNAKIEMSANYTDWTDISGFSNSLTVEGAEREMGELHTADGETPTVTLGKMRPTNDTLKVFYTESSAAPWRKAYDAKVATSLFYLRWAPKGGSVGDLRFTTEQNSSYVSVCPPPSGDFGAPDPAAVEFTVMTKGLSYAAIT